MTLLPVTDCCFLLGVDPKTLRLWLTSAQVTCSPHPTDARLKCLTPSQLYHLAAIHDRFLPDPLPSTVNGRGAQALVPSLSSQGQGVPQPPPEADVRHQLMLLQTQIATLQEQVTQLALVLLREQPHLHGHQPAVAPTTPSLPSALGTFAPAPAAPTLVPASAKPIAPSKASQPRCRVLPLIEEGVDGRFVIISPDQGVLALLPDSAAWFDWLSCIPAFSFQSQHGSFSATRKFRNGQRIQSWMVHRSLHGRSCGLYLSLTPTLTLARLQEMAAAVYARLTAL